MTEKAKMNMEEISKKLANYRQLINFSDSMQKSNYKFVENYISFQMKKNFDGWELDCVEFLNGAIRSQ